MVSSNVTNEEVVEGVSSPDFVLQLRFVFWPMQWLHLINVRINAGKQVIKDLAGPLEDSY